ncbi:hypothetical protein P4123_31635 [Pseudomonas aeruginosa]|nr:hypothetical protein [Pseudomonas aeruginosa]
MTKDEKEKTHVDAIIERYKDLMVEIPPPTSNPVSPALAGSRPARHRQGRPPGRELACRPDRGQLWTASPSAATACPHRCRRPPSKWPS